MQTTTCYINKELLTNDVLKKAFSNNSSSDHLTALVTGHMSLSNLLLATVNGGKIPVDYIPTIVDHVQSCVPVTNDYVVNIVNRDMTGSESLSTVRRSFYEETDIAIVMINMDVAESLNKAVTMWIPELKQQAPTTSTIVLGIHWEKIWQVNMLSPDQYKRENPVTKDDVLRACKDLNISLFIESTPETASDMINIWKSCIIAGVGLKTNSNTIYDPVDKEVNAFMKLGVGSFQVFDASNGEVSPLELSRNALYLNLQIKEAKNLISMDTNGSSDPYFVVYFNDKKIFKSTIIKKSLSPIWNAQIERSLVPQRDGICRLRIEVWDEDALTKNDCMGEVNISINLAAVPTNEAWVRSADWVEIEKGKAKKVSGSIYFSVTLQ